VPSAFLRFEGAALIQIDEQAEARKDEHHGKQRYDRQERLLRRLSNVEVDDPEAYLAKAERLGGKTVVTPTEIATYREIAD